MCCNSWHFWCFQQWHLNIVYFVQCDNLSIQRFDAGQPEHQRSTADQLRSQKLLMLVTTDQSVAPQITECMQITTDHWLRWFLWPEPNCSWSVVTDIHSVTNLSNFSVIQCLGRLLWCWRLRTWLRGSLFSDTRPNLETKKTTNVLVAFGEIINANCVDLSVCQDTESTVYTDAFFNSLHVVVNALDNLEARRYMDRWL